MNVLLILNDPARREPSMVRITQEAREGTRLRLLEAASSEFARVGLKRANINEISVAAGLAKGTVYNYFDSKEELFLAVVEEACRRAAAGWSSWRARVTWSWRTSRNRWPSCSGTSSIRKAGSELLGPR